MLDSFDLPFNSISSFDGMGLKYSNPSKSFWTDARHSRNEQLFIRARIIRVDQTSGTIQVTGIDADVNLEIPITYFHAGSDFHGDSSLPSPGWEVSLFRSENGDYYPMAGYRRPYSESSGWTQNMLEEVSPGDFALSSKNGLKVLFADSGLVQLESSPGCMMIMSPLEDDERIDMLCRRYGLHTDAGNLKFEEHEGTENNSSRLHIRAYNKMTSSPKDAKIDCEITLGSFSLDGASGGFRMDIEGDSFLEMNREGVSRLSSKKTHIDAEKITLGKDSASEPVPLGNQLLSRISSVEGKLNALIASYNVHFHLFPAESGPPTGTPKPLPETPLVPGPDFLSKTSFTI